MMAQSSVVCPSRSTTMIWLPNVQSGGEKPAASASERSTLLQHTGEVLSEYVERFSDVRCSEKVTQQKFRNNGSEKVDLKEESSYDYLVILSNNGGELSLSESRLAVHEAKADKKNRSTAGEQRGTCHAVSHLPPALCQQFRVQQHRRRSRRRPHPPDESRFPSTFAVRDLLRLWYCADASIHWSFPALPGSTPETSAIARISARRRRHHGRRRIEHVADRCRLRAFPV